MNNESKVGCRELERYSSPGGHISTCETCQPLLSSTYRSWKSIIKMVMNPKPGTRDYDSYVVKGIKVPEEWINSFHNFLSDVGIKPSDAHRLRRIDRWSNYSKENCKWYLLEGNVDVGLSVKWKTPEYRAHDALKQRCLNPNHDSFQDYGRRGIKVCDRWLGVNGFRNFLEDLGPKPSREYSIERLDNDGNYEPGNCEWRLMYDQTRNRRSNQWVEYDGRRMTLMDLHKLTGLSKPAIYRRHLQGLRGDDLVAPTRSYVRSGANT